MSSHRLTRIDKLHLQEYRYLKEDDECYYLGEYTPRQGYAFSPTNDLIINLKHSPIYRNQPRWKHKKRAIKRCADFFWNSLSPEWLNSTTLIPIPPSKAKSHPEYDDRILRVLQQICRLGGAHFDVRELLVQRRSYESSHSSEDRLGPGEIGELYSLDAHHLEPAPRKIAVVDDVITTGAHFRAARDLLLGQWPGTAVVGLFVARVVRVPDEDDFPF